MMVIVVVKPYVLLRSQLGGKSAILHGGQMEVGSGNTTSGARSGKKFQRVTLLVLVERHQRASAAFNRSLIGLLNGRGGLLQP